MRDQIIVAEPSGACWLLIGGLALAAGGAWFTNTDDPALLFAAWACVAVGVVATPLLALEVLRPSRLHLTREALIFEPALGRRVTLPWNEIGTFEISGKTLGYRLIASAQAVQDGLPGPGPFTRLSARWAVDLEEMVEVLNDKKRRQSRTREGTDAWRRGEGRAPQ